jgi:hypothetical protein
MTWVVDHSLLLHFPRLKSCNALLLVVLAFPYGMLGVLPRCTLHQYKSPESKYVLVQCMSW